MPLFNARYVGGESAIESPDYTGPVVILEVIIPADQVQNLNKNDEFRREGAAILASAASQAPQVMATPLKGLLGQ